jgi:myo-inositol-1-phosphate synthase
MATRRIGLWLIGACGGVGTTVAVGLSALARGKASTGLVTALPLCEGLDLDEPGQFVVGGHDVRRGSFRESAFGLNERSGIFTARLLEECSDDLRQWSENLRSGVMVDGNATLRSQVELPDAAKARTPREAIKQIQRDLTDFRERNQLDQVIVVNVSSTEPPFEMGPEHSRLESLQKALDKPVLPTSGIYAYAALDIGFPYVNFTPSFGASCPALEELARERKVPHAGKDGKTGETLLKTVLAPMFAARNLNIKSWIGHNILGGGDGRTLNDPANKASKVKTKDAVLSDILGYRPQSLVSIEYVESLDDWKTAWDHIHFEGFLGTKMVMQFTWQGCDSILAAPLVIDLVRLTLSAHRRGESGVLSALACFFKSPMGSREQDFSRQWQTFETYVQAKKLV